MAFLTDESTIAAPPTETRTWWQDVIVALEPIFESVKRSSVGLTQGEIEAKLDDIHNAYAVAHRVNMPTTIQAQLIAAICNLQMSYCARYEGQRRESAKHHRIAQVEWVLFQEMLHHEGINWRIVQ
jgi:hypothetical protein